MTIHLNGCPGDVFDRRECVVDRLDFEPDDVRHGPACFLADGADLLARSEGKR